MVRRAWSGGGKSDCAGAAVLENDFWARSSRHTPPELTARGVLEMSEADEGADLAAIVRDGLARPPAGSSAAALSPSEP